MKENKKIRPLENLLLAYLIKDGNGDLNLNELDKEAEIVFSKQFEATLSEDKMNVLISSLSASLSKETLGSLVQEKLARNKLSVEEVQNQTGLTSSLLEDIKQDMIFTNSIPVKSLVKLFKLLSIPIERAQLAIASTFEKLSTETKMFLALPAPIQPVFRREISNSKSEFDVLRLKSDESYLYQNKEALEKYTKRLGELYDQV